LAQLEHMNAIERRLWSAADTLRANSSYASNEYFLPVMGLIFLRHGYSRYLSVKDGIVEGLPKRGGKTRELTMEDFSEKSAIFLRQEAQFDYLVSLTDSDDRAKAIIDAMDSIEGDYETLRGVLPKGEYQELDNDVLGQLLRTLNPEELKRVSGDVFGRIYEYFLTQFADQKAHDGGEFFTPVSLVSLIANILEPEGGTLLDPACGSGGMFVQSARFIERQYENPVEKFTFFGMEKNATTIRLAKMNLAVHGLEGNIQKAISYYEDPHELLGKANYVMANPPFNVDEIDADKIKGDPRLPFGLPGVNKKEKVSNGNYIWISYFYSYLNEKGRAGFVMSSQASSSGRDEAKVRQKLVETGDVDVMVAIRTNFFYTRTVPCELWFLNRDKPSEFKNKILMIDARNVYRKVTRKIYDFSPEQEQNLLAIVWLYRGYTEKYLDLVAGYCSQMLNNGARCFETEDENGKVINPLTDYISTVESLKGTIEPFIKTLPSDGSHAETLKELDEAHSLLLNDIDSFYQGISDELSLWKSQKFSNGDLKNAIDRLSPLSESSRDLIKQIDLLYKLVCRLIDICEKEHDAHKHEEWNNRDIVRTRKASDGVCQVVVEKMKLVRYFWKQAHWLTHRFPEAKLCDVEGLVKLVDRSEVENSDWSLTPGRYVGVAPEEIDEDFDFEEVMRDIHIELEDLNAEAVSLAEMIKKNFLELGI